MSENPISSSLLAALPGDPLNALEKGANILSAPLGPETTQNRPGWTERYYDYCEAFGILHTYVDQVAVETGVSVSAPELGANQRDNLKLILQYTTNLTTQAGKRRTDIAVERGRGHVKMAYDPPLLYELPESDIARVTELIQELESLISSTDELSEPHRNRLLKRVDSLRSELRNKMSNLDKMWGVAGEVWITAKAVLANPDKANAWMMVVAKLIGIIAAAQAVAQGLPLSEIPKLMPWLGGKE